MAVVITVAQQKGGAGKTTLAANLAAALATRRRVAVFDIDPQHSLARWHALRADGRRRIALSDAAGWRLGAELDRMQGTHDVLIIDSPPQIETEARVAVRSADLVLVPLQPSPPDLWAAEGTLALAAAERRPAHLVLNRVPAGGKLRAEMEAELARRGYPLLAARLGNRTGFATAFARGLGVTEAAPKSAAAAELLTLLDEIEGLLG
ncbi:MAG: AAA family ATPase [Alphaproteobacteria bacterium]|nr:AAA family ATPase [Alphaproteobacteria bacterium]